MSTVRVLNIAPSVDEAGLRDFFGFCGAIQKIEFRRREEYLEEGVDEGELDNVGEDSQMALVVFEKVEGANMARLLSDSLLVDRPVSVICEKPKKAGDAEAVKEDAGSFQQGGSFFGALREGAAKAREMADKAKAAAAVLDEQHAISARVRATVHGLDDERSLRDKVGGLTSKASATASKLMESDTAKSGLGFLRAGLASLASAVAQAESANRAQIRASMARHAAQETARQARAGADSGAQGGAPAPADGEVGAPAGAQSVGACRHGAGAAPALSEGLAGGHSQSHGGEEPAAEGAGESAAELQAATGGRGRARNAEPGPAVEVAGDGAARGGVGRDGESGAEPEGC